MSRPEIRDNLRDILYTELVSQRRTLHDSRNVRPEPAGKTPADLLRIGEAARSLEIGRQRRADEARRKAERNASESAHALIGAEERAAEQAVLKEARLAREADPGYVKPERTAAQHESVCPSCGAANQYFRICGSCRRVRRP
jgi:hypothetical protein